MSFICSLHRKEAQKCFCGSANCRGYLGGENRVSIRAAGGKMKKERSRKKDSVSVPFFFQLSHFKKEVTFLVEL